jgi:magnesium-transporting ATPase (P-type)
MDESCFKKQMEMRGGKCHQIITDQEDNSNRIFANRYYGRSWVGIWYFLIDCVYHFENILIVVVIAMVLYGRSISTTSSSQLSIPLYFPLAAFLINVCLMATRNIIFEMRQLKVTQKVNGKTIEYLNVTRTSSKFVPITWEKIRPGHIIRILRGEEFPADCLVLDIQGQSGQTCYVTRGPFDGSISIVQKRSF